MSRERIAVARHRASDGRATLASRRPPACHRTCTPRCATATPPSGSSAIHQSGRRSAAASGVHATSPATSDVVASNGVIHVIDAVLLPPK
jgi:hypothetical protein